MNNYIVARHFVNNDETLDTLLSNHLTLETAQEISRKNAFNFRIALKLTIEQKELPKNIYMQIQEYIRIFPKNIYLSYSEKNKGPGSSSREILFNPEIYDNPQTIICIDFDQFIIDSEEALGNIADIISINQDKLYGLGSRDVAVKLSPYERNSNIRIIQELFHSLAIGSNKLRVQERKENVTPAYAEIGESTSGFTIVNVLNPSYKEFQNRILEAARIANFKGFASEYFTAILASEYGEMIKGYVQSKENVFYHKNSEERDLENILRLIKSQTSELGKTTIANRLLNSLKLKANTERISEFYPKQDVELVRDLMIRSLEG